MPFGLLARMGPMNHVLDEGLDLQWKGEILGKRAPVVKYSDILL